MVNSPLIRPYFLGGVALGGVPLDSHHIVALSQAITMWIFFVACSTTTVLKMIPTGAETRKFVRFLLFNSGTYLILKGEYQYMQVQDRIHYRNIFLNKYLYWI